MARYEPDFEVYFVRGGARTSLRHRVMDFEFSDSAEETDLTAITVEDIATDLLNDPALLDDGQTELHYRFGYVGQMSALHTAIVTMVKPDFPQSGAVTIQIKAHDKGIVANKDIKTRVWERTEGYRPDEIASAIAAELGLTATVEACKESTRKLRWKQAKETDLEFLKRLTKEAVPEKAQQNSNYLLHVDGDQLVFATKNNDGGHTHEYDYFPSKGGNLLSFSPEIQEKKEEATTETRSAATGDKVRSEPGTTPRTSLGRSDVNAPKNTGMGPQQPGGMPAPKKPRDTGMGPQEPGAEKGGTTGSGKGRVFVDPVTGRIWRR